MGVRETTQARRAALLLHALPRAAREQVLARLTAAESSRLKPLLSELVELGVPTSLGEQLQSISVAPQPSIPSAASARELSIPEQVARLSADDVARRLESCAAVTVARLMSAGDWPWKSQVLGLMSEARRAAVRKHLHGNAPTLAPAVSNALCERLCRQPDHLNTAPAQASPPSTTARTSAMPRPAIRSTKRPGRWLRWMR